MKMPQPSMTGLDGRVEGHEWVCEWCERGLRGRIVAWRPWAYTDEVFSWRTLARWPANTAGSIHCADPPSDSLEGAVGNTGWGTSTPRAGAVRWYAQQEDLSEGEIVAVRMHLVLRADQIRPQVGRWSCSQVPHPPGPTNLSVS